MAIKFKGTETSGLQPTGLGEREIALNLTDRTIYSVNSLNSIIEFLGTDENAVWGNITGTLANQTDLQNALDSKEGSLGNPTVDGYVLSSTTLGVRTWVEQSVGGGSFNIEGGSSSSIYTAPQVIDGGASL